MINFCIVHYNTPKLTECLVKSINKYTPDCNIYIFDNSTTLPFTYRQSNIHYIDNTKGQIINFDKWLEQYPRRKFSPGKLNHWGSAKHCYSVEKCMELIPEGFILLDSDILLKKDVSCFWDESKMYVGKQITQPRSVIVRILPFICYINCKMCKENDVHYFNPKYMHGLMYYGNSDLYDTGAGFYMMANKYPHTDLMISEYIVHYASGSWDQESRAKRPKAFTASEWLNINKRFWDNNTMNKKVVYTCITGSYEGLQVPTSVLEGWDYVCFTDDAEAVSPIWDIRPIPTELLSYSKVKQQRGVKILPHRYLPEYDISVWVDGSVDVKGNIDDYINSACTDGSIFIPQHPNRNCIYKEAKACLSIKKDTPENINPQMDRFRSEGFPEEYGLVQSNIVIRRHNEEDCKLIMEEWWGVLKDGSHRDQLSFNYALWKHPEVKMTYLDKKLCDSQYFFWDKFHGKRPSTSSSSRTSVGRIKRTVPIVKSEPKKEAVLIHKEAVKKPEETKTAEETVREKYNLDEIMPLSKPNSPKRVRPILRYTHKKTEQKSTNPALNALKELLNNY